MQTHIKRAVMLLVMVIFLFIVLRSIIVPASFGQYDWYRGNSVNDIRNIQVEHAGSATCGEETCHKTIYEVWKEGRHKTVNCETCHGPAEKHVSDIRILPQPANETREYCGLCHFERIARPASFPQIDPETHGENLSCAYCHNPHKPWFV